MQAIANAPLSTRRFMAIVSHPWGIHLRMRDGRQAEDEGPVTNGMWYECDAVWFIT